MTPKALLDAALARKHVTGLPWGHCTAAFVIGMQFREVARWLPKMKVYNPKKKRKPRWAIPSLKVVA